jgi:hypothetical protein
MVISLISSMMKFAEQNFHFPIVGRNVGICMGGTPSAGLRGVQGVQLYRARAVEGPGFKPNVTRIVLKKRRI